jgi:general secretion pathway protein G
MNPGLRRKTLLIVLGVLLLVGGWLSLPSLLATFAPPVLGKNVHIRTREVVLKTNLRTLRDVIGQHYKDKGSYPDTLETLVQEGYLRKIPMDPITKSSNTWIPVREDGRPGIADVKSGAPGRSLDGQPYGEW